MAEFLNFENLFTLQNLGNLLMLSPSRCGSFCCS